MTNHGKFTFQDLLEQSWNDRIADTLAMKLRYRFGSWKFRSNNL